VASRLHPDSCIPMDINKAVGTGRAREQGREISYCPSKTERPSLTVVLGSSIGKDIRVLGTRSKDLRVVSRVGDGDQVAGLDGRRVPTTRVTQSAVEPPEGTVGVISR